MLEHDYLMLTEKFHQCVLQDLEENDSKMTCALPVSHLLYNMKKEEFGLKKVMNKSSLLEYMSKNNRLCK